jgi:DNA polymerase bacteriophage-type
MKGPFLRMILPSGRALHYCRPKIEVKKMPWGDMKECLTYEGLDTYKRWTRIDTHPGKLTENADQAIARDLLAHGMILADKEGIDVRLHVHDQILGLSDEDKADEELLILKQCMEDQPSWAKGLPLGSAGFTSPIFIKD